MTTSTASRLWFGAVALAVLVAFGVQFYLLFTGGADANSGESGSDVPLAVRFVRLFSFFTIQSNVLVLVAAALLASGRRWKGWLGRVLHLDALLGILVTATVFGFILAPGLQLRDAAVVATNLFHLVSPVLFVVGWLLFGPRRQFTVRHALLAFVWPALWLASTFTVGALTGWYPYPFLDVGVVGVLPAALGAGAVVVYAAVLAVVLLLVDRRVPAFGSRERA